MSNNDVSKLAGPLQNRVATSGTERQGRTTSAGLIPLYVEAEPGQVGQARRELEARGLTVRSEQNDYLAVDADTATITDLASVDAIRHIQERRQPKPHDVTPDNITEGLGIMNADTLQNEGITGSGARIAVIDHYFHTENPKYRDNILATVGSDTYFTTDAEYSGGTQHGTACAEIVSDLAPDAELILATTQGSKSFGEIMDEIETYDPDGATMSLGFYTGLRIDGQDVISNRVDQFTDGGRIFACSAGNSANGEHWDGAFVNDGNDLMEFDSSLSTPTRYPVTLNSQTEVHVHWDADWSLDNQRYKVRLYENESDPVGDNSAHVFQQTTTPVEVISPSQSGVQTYYLEIEKVNATGTEHFDIFPWGAVLDGPTTPERSLGIPATSPDPNTLAVAAVQATDYGRMPNAEDLKSYSSQGPTQDGRRGLDVAAPSFVSTTDVDDYGGYGPIENGGAFNGTSAASPHVGGLIGLLYDSDLSATRDERRQAIFDTGRGIADSSVSAPGSNNTKIGFGYVDAEAARDEIAVALNAPLSTKWTSNDMGGRAQYNTPAVDSQQVYVGGLQNAFYALSVDDGTSVGWTFDRGSKAGLSDSSGYRWNDQIFFGSGQGKLYGLDADDATRYWSSQDTPDLGSAITSSPVVSNSTVFVGTNDGHVYAFDASTANQQWSTSVGGPVYSDLAAANGLVYVTTRDGDLVVLGTANGDEQWRASFPAFGASSPTLGGGRVYVASDEVYAFDAAASKSQVWSSSGYGGTAGSNPTFDGGAVYVGSSDGNLYALDASNGSENWTHSTGDAIASTPAVDDTGTRIAVASMDGTLYLLDDSGSQLDTMSIPAGTRASPTISSGVIFLGSNSGTVYAFE